MSDIQQLLYERVAASKRKQLLAASSDKKGIKPRSTPLPPYARSTKGRSTDAGYFCTRSNLGSLTYLRKLANHPLLVLSSEGAGDDDDDAELRALVQVPRIPIAEATISVQFVRGMPFLVLDFGVCVVSSAALAYRAPRASVFARYAKSSTDLAYGGTRMPETCTLSK
eukprot:1151235-Rhodomonas_salina.1